MKGDFIAKLKAQLSYLSGVEKKIAQEILRDARAFIEMTMAELSDKIGVSQGSIVNFAKKMVGGGFPRLKIEIAACLEGYKPLGDDACGVQVYESIAFGAQSAVQNTQKLNDSGVIERVAQLIRTAKKVELVGVYRSGLVANDFCYQLMDIGIPAIYIPDFYSFTVSASMLESHDLLIAVSSTGRTKVVLDAVSLAKENGAKIVVITQNPLSPIAKLADEILVAADSGTSIMAIPCEVRISQLALVDAVCEYLRAHSDLQTKQQFERNRIILNMQAVED